MTYKWNLSEIRTKQRYLLERLKNCKDPKEKELIELSLVSNVSILSNSGSILNTRFYNFLDSLTNGKFSLIKHGKPLACASTIDKGTPSINEGSKKRSEASK